AEHERAVEVDGASPLPARQPAGHRPFASLHQHRFCVRTPACRYMLGWPHGPPRRQPDGGQDTADRPDAIFRHPLLTTADTTKKRENIPMTFQAVRQMPEGQAKAPSPAARPASLSLSFLGVSMRFGD